MKKRWQESKEELYKKGINDPDNHDGLVTHLEPNILECEVKWALGSFTTNKARGGDGIPAELFLFFFFQLSYFKSKKMMLYKCFPQYDSKFGKLSSGHRTEKGQFSFQSQRREMPKNAQTIALLSSFYMRAR